MGIYTNPTQTSHYSSKPSRYDLYRYGTAVPTRGIAAMQHCCEIRGTVVALKNSTGHLTEIAITFYSKLHFQ